MLAGSYTLPEVSKQIEASGKEGIMNCQSLKKIPPVKNSGTMAGSLECCSARQLWLSVAQTSSYSEIPSRARKAAARRSTPSITENLQREKVWFHLAQAGD
jgi:hypothetical protein